MKAKKEYNLGSVVAEGTMQAAADMLHKRGLRVADIDVDALVVSLRTEAKAALGRILDDGKALLDAGRGAWVDTLVKTECLDAARRAVAAVL